MMRASLRASVLITGLCAGCLPLGPAPTGRRVLADGTAYQVQFLPGPDGAPASLTTLRLTGDSFGPFSIFAVHEPTDGDGLGTETFLLDHVGGGVSPRCAGSQCSSQTDSQGRIFVQHSLIQATNVSPGVISGDTSLARIDPVTNQVLDFGSMSQLVGTFLDRTALAYMVQGSLRVRDSDDTESRFERALSAAVVNDVLYFQTRDDSMGQGTVRRLAGRPLDAPEPVASNVTFFQGYAAAAPFLVLCRTMTGDTGCNSSLLDLSTGQETPLPDQLESIWSVAPSGRYLLSVVASSDPTSIANISSVISLFDRALGSLQSVTVANLSAVYWRPGRDELWFVATPFDAGAPPDVAESGPLSFWRWRPGTDPAIAFSQQAPFSAITSDSSTWPFTPDGRFLLTFSTLEQTDKPTVSLRAADAPQVALLALNPTGTGVQDVRQLGDGRLVVSDWITDSNSADIYLVDPDAGTMRPLGHGGNVVATGATRIMALLDWLAGGGSGSLSLIDLDTGATTLLAENVHSVSVEPAAPGADPLAPGTRVAYVSRNRVASRYDGLWIAGLP